MKHIKNEALEMAGSRHVAGLAHWNDTKMRGMDWGVRPVTGTCML